MSKKTPTCYYCKTEGHVVQKCPELCKCGDPDKSHNRKKHTCKFCGTRGSHSSIQCSKLCSCNEIKEIHEKNDHLYCAICKITGHMTNICSKACKRKDCILMGLHLESKHWKCQVCWMVGDHKNGIGTPGGCPNRCRCNYTYSCWRGNFKGRPYNLPLHGKGQCCNICRGLKFRDGEKVGCKGIHSCKFCIGDHTTVEHKCEKCGLLGCDKQAHTCDFCDGGHSTPEHRCEKKYCGGSGHTIKTHIFGKTVKDFDPYLLILYKSGKTNRCALPEDFNLGILNSYGEMPDSFIDDDIVKIIYIKPPAIIFSKPTFKRYIPEDMKSLYPSGSQLRF